MIKILPLPAAGPLNQGGQYTYCINLVNLLDNSDEIQFDKIEQPICKRLPLLNKMWFSWKSLYKRIKESNCDIVFINGYAELTVWQEFIVAKLLKKTIVYAPHFHPFSFLERPKLGKYFFNLAIRPLLKWAECVVTIGKTDYAFFGAIKRVRKVYMVPHHFLKPEEKTHKVYRKKNMILFVGRNEPNKGMDYLYLLPHKYEVHCVTGGNLERVDFIQHTNISSEELDKLYKEASLVVIPSRYEAFSYVALEAFTRGTPVVMSSNVKIADYLNGIDGYLIFPWGDKQAFLDAVDQGMSLNVDRISILSKFEPSKIRNEYIEIFTTAYKNSKFNRK